MIYFKFFLYLLLLILLISGCATKNQPILSMPQYIEGLEAIQDVKRDIQLDEYQNILLGEIPIDRLIGKSPTYIYTYVTEYKKYIKELRISTGLCIGCSSCWISLIILGNIYGEAVFTEGYIRF